MIDMKTKKSRKPKWKEAQELAPLYRERGIQYCYNERNHKVYLSLLHAPYCNPTVSGCQLTGYFILYGGVDESRDIDGCISRVAAAYRRAYHGNETMLAYLTNVITEA